MKGINDEKIRTKKRNFRKISKTSFDYFNNCTNNRNTEMISESKDFIKAIKDIMIGNFVSTNLLNEYFL